MRRTNFLPAEVAEKNEELQELQALLQEISSRDLPETSVQEINKKTEALKASEATSEKTKAVKNEILEMLRKEHGLVPENYYTTLWMPLGMCAFGLPIGVVLFAIADNASFIAIGLPLGLGLGGLYGAQLDKKAEARGKLLKFQNKKEKK